MHVRVKCLENRYCIYIYLIHHDNSNNNYSCVLINIVLLQLALIVAQSRDRNGVLSPINLTALNDGLRRVALQAKKMKGLLCCVIV